MPVLRACGRAVPWALVCSAVALLRAQPARQVPPFPRTAPLSAMAPAWSADDRTIAYMTRRDEPDALMAVPSTGGTPTAIFADGHSYASPDFARDGTKLAFSSNRSGPWSIWIAGPEGQNPTPLTPNQFARVFTPTWSPDGDRIAYSAVASSSPALMVLQIRGGASERLGGGWRPRWSPDGTRIAYTDRFREGATELEAIAVRTVEDGSTRRLAATRAPLRTRAMSGDWSPDGRRIVFVRRIDTSSELVAIDVASETVTLLARLPGYVFEPAWSHAGDRIAFESIESDHVGEVHVVTLPREAEPSARTGKAPVTVLTPSDRGVHGRFVEYASDPGVTVPGWLYEPPAPVRRGPALVWLHGGFPGEWMSDDVFDQGIQYFVSQGYAVFAPNFRGSAGYGEQIAHFPGPDAVVRDIVAAGAYVRGLRSVDPARVGLIGFSGGGFWTATTAVAAPTAFGAAADFFGPVDLEALYRSAPAHRPNLERLLGPLEGHEKEYHDHSPLYAVERLTVPMLVVHSDADRIIPVAQSIAFDRELHRQNKRATFLHLAKSGHDLGGEEKAAAFEGAAAFFAEHLK